MGRTACTEPQCLYKGAIYLFFFTNYYHSLSMLLLSPIHDQLVSSLNFSLTQLCKLICNEVELDLKLFCS